MVWPLPVKTWISGELIKQGDMNTEIRDRFLVLKTSLDDDGKLRGLSSSYVADLDGTALTGIPKLAEENDFTATNNFNAAAGSRVVIPVGANKWAT